MVSQEITQSRPKVFVGLSGGVDSSVSAALLTQARTPKDFKEICGFEAPHGFSGFDVTGVFIKVWQPDFVECSAGDDRRDAMRVAVHLGIPFLIFNFAEEYKREVADYMIAEYAAGRTPNPDVMCNRHIKFGAFLRKAREMGADFVATGHYARKEKAESLPERTSVRAGGKLKVEERNGNGESGGGLHSASYSLLSGIDSNKDQTYFLWTLAQKQLQHVLFPVGKYTKPEVRALARQFDLPTAEKRESQGVCFIGKFDMHEFLAHYIPRKPGNVLSPAREIIGKHDGATFYTIGQRHGFEVAAQTAHSTPLYVVEKDVTSNTIVVADELTAHAPKGGVRGKEAYIREVNWISGARPEEGTYSARIRHRQPLQTCRLSYVGSPTSHIDGDSHSEAGSDPAIARVIFDEPQWAIAPGQSLVLYDGETCLGGGVIM